MNRNNPFIHIAIIITFIILQSVLFTKIEVLPAFPDIAFIVFIFSSISLGSAKAQTIGFLSGLVLDFLSFAPLGFFSLIYAIIGFLLGKMKGKYFIDPVLIPIILTIICCSLRSFMAALIAGLFINDEISFFSLKFLIEIGMNLVLAPIIIALLKLFKSISFIEKEFGA